MSQGNHHISTATLRSDAMTLHTTTLSVIIECGGRILAEVVEKGLWLTSSRSDVDIVRSTELDWDFQLCLSAGIMKSELNY